MIVVGLTGSIGMGKTTAAGMFRSFGIPVFDADRCVHDLYAGAAVEPVGVIFPTAIRDARIDRKVLASLVLNDPKAMARLEEVIHPLVAARRQTFLNEMRSSGRRLVVLDIPLLFEIGSSVEVDVIVVVSALLDDQRKRVLARVDMDEVKLAAILKRQVPDVEKCRQAHFIVQTSRSLTSVRRQISTVISSLIAIEGTTALRDRS
jgi:dephospho-CoA kinase